MSSATRVRPTSDERLVLEVNRIFHDLEGARYDEKHDEIFVSEAERWQRIAGTWLAGADHPRAILDVGTGTGFVPRAIGPILRPDDEYVLSDLSISMLACARTRLEAEPVPCKLRFEPVDGERYPFPSKSFDAITGNSVVHHIPDLRRFFTEMDRLLKPGGLLLIGHEPNLVHYRTKGLHRRAKLLSLVSAPLNTVIGLAKVLQLHRILGGLGLRRKVRGAVLRARGGGIARQVRETEEILDQVGTQLVERGILAVPPTREQLVQWIDVHSPTAGAEVDPTRGLDVDKVRRVWLPDYEVMHLETYDHLFEDGHAAKRGGFAGFLDRRLAKKYPDAGRSLFFVLKKPGISRVPALD